MCLDIKYCQIRCRLFNDIFILLLVPLFDYVIYPAFKKCNLLVMPLQKFSLEGFMACGSFAASGCLELFILQQFHPVLPPQNQIGFIGYNGIDPIWNCSLPNVFISTQMMDEVEVGKIQLRNEKYLSNFINYTNDYRINGFIIDCDNGIEIVYDDQKFSKPFKRLPVSQASFMEIKQQMNIKLMFIHRLNMWIGFKVYCSPQRTYLSDQIRLWKGR